MVPFHLLLDLPEDLHPLGLLFLSFLELCIYLYDIGMLSNYVYNFQDNPTVVLS